MTETIALRDVKQEVLRVGDVDVSLRRKGNGPVLLFLHGANGVLNWSPFFESLAKRFDIWIPDHPGFGETADQKWIRSVGDLAYFYLDFMKVAGLRNAAVVGHSLGGWLAAEIGIRDCSSIRNITFISPAGVRLKGVSVGDNFIWAPDELIRNLYFDPKIAETIIDAMKAPEVRNAVVRNQRASAKFGWEPRWFNPQLEYWLHRIDVPSQVIWGEHDRLFPVALGERWCELLPRTRMHRLAVGHVPQIEKPDEVADLIFKLAGEDQ